MSNFIGRFRYSIDGKGRLFVPAPMRTEMDGGEQGTFIFSRGADGCLDGYPLDEWTKRVEALRSIPNKKSGRYYKRLTIGEAASCKMDTHHRVLISRELLSSVGIEDSVLIIGQIDHIELWNPERYEAYLASQQVPLEDVLEEIERLMHR